MNTKRLFPCTLVIGLVIAAVILIAAASSSGTSLGMGDAWAARAPAPQDAAVPLDSVYAGQVKLDWALAGVYSDTLPTPQPEETPPDMGSIDLGLLLYRSEDTVIGYSNEEHPNFRTRSTL